MPDDVAAEILNAYVVLSGNASAPRIRHARQALSD